MTKFLRISLTEADDSKFKIEKIIAPVELESLRIGKHDDEPIEDLDSYEVNNKFVVTVDADGDSDDGIIVSPLVGKDEEDISKIVDDAFKDFEEVSDEAVQSFEVEETPEEFDGQEDFELEQRLDSNINDDMTESKKKALADKIVESLNSRNKDTIESYSSKLKFGISSLRKVLSESKESKSDLDSKLTNLLSQLKEQYKLLKESDSDEQYVSEESDAEKEDAAWDAYDKDSEGIADDETVGDVSIFSDEEEKQTLEGEVNIDGESKFLEVEVIYNDDGSVLIKGDPREILVVLTDEKAADEIMDDLGSNKIDVDPTMKVESLTLKLRNYLKENSDDLSSIDSEELETLEADDSQDSNSLSSDDVPF